TLFYDPFTKGISVSANFCALVQSEHVTLSKEHDAFCWCTPEEAREKLAFPAQKETLSFIHQHFVLNEPHHVSRLDINETNLLA
ncbi:MAG: hypothetical protein KDK48_05000, partial [Chlamydiia bacterium]|nr:hypothetical protein [Chlamydiia bacterium]